MTKAELEKRVAELETELAWRRNHVCPQQAYIPQAGVCSCGTGRVLTFPPPCPVHGFPSQVFTTTLRPELNTCGAAAYNGWQTQVIDVAGANPVVRDNLPGYAAPGAWAGQTYTVTIPAG